MARNTDEYRQFTEEYRSFLYDTLADLPVDELVSLWNKAVEDPKFHHDGDYRIYAMDEFDDEFNNATPLEVAQWVYNSDRFCPNDDYFWVSDYDGGWESNDILHIGYFPYDIYDLIDHIMTTGKDYGCEPLLDAINDFTSRHN